MRLLIILLLSILWHTTMEAQKRETFLYDLELIEKFKTKSQWTDKEHEIQKAHVNYLDSLTNSRKIFLAGIKEQGLKHHTGLVILNVSNYEEAFKIVQNDPSIKTGMMVGHIKKINIYFLMPE
ncbi:MAG: hypothetical protein ED556_09015 [Winogradskyella sp.]|uniref:YciI family protein n=1 Tax=Winogradskyella sp. TaxID=1883156 RepID=UPI000F3CCB00|nr:YciI family protein [Winogradskyella sp.]RNC86420.1 MAG: hypothetical protein ED556_09015 [Winogradskyella sp.]